MREDGNQQQISYEHRNDKVSHQGIPGRLKLIAGPGDGHIYFIPYFPCFL